MKQKLLAVLCLVWLSFSALYAVQQPYQSGKIVDVQPKVNTEVLYYQVNTPITRDNPYFEISIQVKDQVYVGEYTPRHSADGLPEEWKPGADVQVRLDKRDMYVKKPAGGELQFAIEKRSPVTPATPNRN